MSLLRTILQKVEVLEKRAKNPSQATGRLPVEGYVLALQLQYPDMVWTSDDFAREIGCSGAAVRKTRTWRDYQERREISKQQRLQRKGWKDKEVNIEAFDADGSDDSNHRK
jgi:hypothetical protein